VKKNKYVKRTCCCGRRCVVKYVLPQYNVCPECIKEVKVVAPVNPKIIKNPAIPKPLEVQNSGTRTELANYIPPPPEIVEHLREGPACDDPVCKMTKMCLVINDLAEYLKSLEYELLPYKIKR